MTVVSWLFKMVRACSGVVSRCSAKIYQSSPHDHLKKGDPAILQKDFIGKIVGH